MYDIVETIKEWVLGTKPVLRRDLVFLQVDGFKGFTVTEKARLRMSQNNDFIDPFYLGTIAQPRRCVVWMARA